MAHAPSAKLNWLLIGSRVSAAVLGGYAFAWGFTSCVVALNLAIGGDYHEGLTLAYLLAFGVYLVALLWAFAAQSLTRVWLVLGGGAGAMLGAAWGLTHMLASQH